MLVLAEVLEQHEVLALEPVQGFVDSVSPGLDKLNRLQDILDDFRIHWRNIATLNLSFELLEIVGENKFDAIKVE